MTHDECTPTPEYMDCTCCEGCGEHVLGPVGSPDVTVYPCGTCNAWGYLCFARLPASLRYAPSAFYPAENIEEIDMTTTHFHLWYGTEGNMEEIPGTTPEVCFTSEEEALAIIPDLRAAGPDWAEWEDDEGNMHPVLYEARETEECISGAYHH